MSFRVELNLEKLVELGAAEVRCHEYTDPGIRCDRSMVAHQYGLWECRAGHTTYMPDTFVKVRSA